jgi:protein ImuB
MPGRWLSLWLPDLPIDRLRLVARRRREPWPEGAALALVAAENGAQRLVAVNAEARRYGLHPGQGLADARAILPALRIRDADRDADARALDALVAWCGRYSPRVAADGPDGILIDIAGCGHLFGGERRLLRDLSTRLARWGLGHRLGLADRQAAAWAWARFGDGPILPPAGARERLLALPTAALRLEPPTTADLGRLGLRRIGQLAELPPAVLLARFDPAVVARLEALLGDADEPFTPAREPRSFTARLAWPEPIGRTADLAAALRQLLDGLAAELLRAQAGARLVLAQLYRVDGAAVTLRARTSAPSRDPAHLHRLLASRLDGLEIGFGIELVVVEIAETAPLAARQTGLARDSDAADLAALVDRLATRLGPDRVLRPAPVDSHLPERAQALLRPGEPLPERPWPERPPRPLRLYTHPVPVDAIATVPDGPPQRLVTPEGPTRIVQASGPERIAPEWWCDPDGRTRDLYRVRTERGDELWVAREGGFDDPTPPRWRLTGTFD